MIRSGHVCGILRYGSNMFARDHLAKHGTDQPTELFTVSEPRSSLVDLFYVVQKLRSRCFKALEL